ncbi:MAG: hypothetical protein MZV65_17800 [Chromatiales bacterium]|nr:hypothetical protein [Chromatiales bacterium]
MVDAALPVIERQRRPRVPAVHHAARADAPRASCSTEAIASAGLDLPLLVQGEGSRTRAARRASARSATRCCSAAQSFWEGVDVPRRGAVAGDHRQAAVRAAGRSGAGGARSPA